VSSEITPLSEAVKGGKSQAGGEVRGIRRGYPAPLGGAGSSLCVRAEKANLDAQVTGSPVTGRSRPIRILSPADAWLSPERATGERRSR